MTEFDQGSTGEFRVKPTAEELSSLDREIQNDVLARMGDDFDLQYESSPDPKGLFERLIEGDMKEVINHYAVTTTTEVCRTRWEIITKLANLPAELNNIDPLTLQTSGDFWETADGMLLQDALEQLDHYFVTPRGELPTYTDFAYRFPSPGHLTKTTMEMRDGAPALRLKEIVFDDNGPRAIESFINEDDLAYRTPDENKAWADERQWQNIQQDLENTNFKPLQAGAAKAWLGRCQRRLAVHNYLNGLSVDDLRETLARGYKNDVQLDGIMY